MNHTITIGGLLLSLCVLGGLVMAAIGGLMVAAAGMSDAGDDGTGTQGCVIFLVGIALAIGALVALIA